MITSSERLIVRESTLDDLPYHLAMGKDLQVMQYIRNGETRSDEKISEILKIQIEDYRKYSGLGIWAVCLRENNSFVGVAGLKHLDQTEDIELGYRYLKEYWGLGIATEASQLLLHYGFQKLKLPQIVAITHPENKGSVNVIEKLGFQYQKNAHYYETDVLYYTLDSMDYV